MRHPHGRCDVASKNCITLDDKRQSWRIDVKAGVAVGTAAGTAAWCWDCHVSRGGGGPMDLRVWPRDVATHTL